MSLALIGTVAATALLSGTLTGIAPVSFSAEIVPLLRTQCATCHLTGKEAGSIALHPRAAYANLVGVPSVESKLLRVKPGAPDESYLMRKLDGTHLDAGGSGARMPFGAAPLDAATLAKIRAWIAIGAPEN
jgi:hypothetical protein